MCGDTVARRRWTRSAHVKGTRYSLCLQSTKGDGGRATHVQPAQQLALHAGAVLQGIPGARLPPAPGVLRPLRMPAGVRNHYC